MTLQEAQDWCRAHGAQVSWLAQCVEVKVYQAAPDGQQYARYYFGSTLTECVEQAQVDFPADELPGALRRRIAAMQRRLARELGGSG